MQYTLASKTAEIEALKAVSSASNGQHRVAQQGQQTKVENVLDLYATSTENNELLSKLTQISTENNKFQDELKKMSTENNKLQSKLTHTSTEKDR